MSTFCPHRNLKSAEGGRSTFLSCCVAQLPCTMAQGSNQKMIHLSLHCTIVYFCMITKATMQRVQLGLNTQT